MLTSRIVQASAAVQLFVQRCLMNLEQGVSLSLIDTAQWEWMKNFRVWQANREVFLYPENWMVPQLRDDKTPFFEDLESALLQNPMTAANVEQAYMDYLTALNEVARLDIRGTYWQFDPNSTPAPDLTPDATNDVLHVFGRTPATPYKYFYRRLLNCSQYGLQGGQPGSGASWTPWEAVDLDIQGDHLIPVVWDGRLYLFWPTFTESAEASKQTPVPIPQPGDPPPPQPKKDVSITLSWSEYKQGTWSSKLTSDPLMFEDFYFVFFEIPPLDTSSFNFNASFSDDALTIEVDLHTNGYLGEGQKNFVVIGKFTFSHCGNSPSLWPSLQNANSIITGALLCPLTAWLNYNAIEEEGVGSFILNVGYGCYGPSVSVAPIEVSSNLDPVVPPPVTLLPFTMIWSLYKTLPGDYYLMFPHQFFPSYGLLVPPPYTNQPFFYQDDQRVYFVTESFTDPSTNVADPSMESPFYIRATLAAAPGTGTSSVVFPDAQNNRTVASVAPSAALSRTKSVTASATAQPEIGTATTGVEAAPTGEQTSMPSQITFSTFFHPHVCAFLTAVNRYGVPQLLTLGTQALTNDNGILSGFILEPNYGTTPALTPGILTAQGQLYESTTIPDPNLGALPDVSNAYNLFFNALTPSGDPGVQFYYSQNAPPDPHGDAFLGTVQFSLLGVAVNAGSTVFETTYDPNITYIARKTFPRENVDFSPTGAYSIYNWELFFHIPLLIATSLSQNQQFENAQKWFHYIFNPTTSSTDAIPQRHWNCLPFYECEPWDETTGQIQNLLYEPASGGPSAQPSLCGQSVADQIYAMNNDPFNPFVIGRMRTVAFRMKVVMAYLDNLIAWGDSLFGQNTRESINEATQIYVLAKEILGPRPTQIAQRGEIQDYTYNDLRTLYGFGPLNNALVQMENDLPYLTTSSTSGSTALSSALSMASRSLYFCVPPNNILLGYWDTVDDRLYKIRHCMNIQGVVEQLPLFAPPISPALLVQAAAAGVDLSSVLSNMSAGTPFYRFSVMVQKALELCAEVRSLGAALLSALEKQDAEALSLLRATQEIKLLTAMQHMKQSAVDEANANLIALNDSLAVMQGRQQYYQGLIKDGLSSYENAQISGLNAALPLQSISQDIEKGGSALAATPTFSFGVDGFGGTPSATMSMGGSKSGRGGLRLQPCIRI